MTYVFLLTLGVKLMKIIIKETKNVWNTTFINLTKAASVLVNSKDNTRNM